MNATVAGSSSAFGILNALDCAYFEMDLKGTMLFVNERFCEKSEAKLGMIIGKHYRHIVEHSMVTKLFKTFNDIYNTKEKAGIQVNFLRHKSGGYHIAEGTASPILNTEGDVVGFRGILFDVTKRVLEERELASLKNALENELAIGRKIQFSFLPTSFEQVEGWEIDVRFHSAREVAGDFYDVFPVSSGTRLGFVVADVCDKGIGAAMYMAIFRTLIRAFANINVSTYLPSSPQNEAEIDSMIIRKPKHLGVGVQPLLNAIQTTNQYIARHHGFSNMFATVFLGVLNPQDGKVFYINAGHEPPVVISGGKIKARLEPTGPAVGLMEDLPFEVGELELAPGDLLFAYTDGVTDAKNEKEEAFSENRLLALLSENSDTPENSLRRVMSAVHDHIGDHDQFDDLTALSIYRKKSS